MSSSGRTPQALTSNLELDNQCGVLWTSNVQINIDIYPKLQTFTEEGQSLPRPLTYDFTHTSYSQTPHFCKEIAAVG